MAAPVIGGIVADRPNIVIMLLDNVGYGDPGCYGGGITRMAPTPRIDRLAAEGLRLTNFNVEAECTPTRAALMTGRMPIRSGCQRVNPPGGKRKNGLAPWEYTLADLLSDVGYRTAIFGKWHLGERSDRHPTAQGFDEWFGIQDSTAPAMYSTLIGFDHETMITPKIWEGVAGEDAQIVEEYTTMNRPFIDERITNRAVSYIHDRAAADEPFFCYVPFTQVHHPVLPHPDFEGRSGNGAYADAMIEVDYRAGQVIDAVDQAGIADDTIVIWASDNGPIQVPSMGVQGDSGPWRGFLGTPYEGQLRVPCVIRWPRRVDPGRASDEIVSIMDFYATFANIVGAKEHIPTDRAIDSVDQTALLLGAQETSDREHLLCFIGDDLAAFKWRQFKMYFKEYGTTPGHRYKVDLALPQLFNVAQDPKELWDIMEPNTWMAQASSKYIGRYLRSLKEFPNVPVGGDGPVADARTGPITPRG